MPSYTRTTQQWQWLIGKLWHGSYRCRCPDNENPYLSLIQTIETTLTTIGQIPVDSPISVVLSELDLEEVKPDYADALRRSATLGRQPHDDVLPELLERLPGENPDHQRRSAPLPKLRGTHTRD